MLPVQLRFDKEFQRLADEVFVYLSEGRWGYCCGVGWEMGVKIMDGTYGGPSFGGEVLPGEALWLHLPVVSDRRDERFWLILEWPISLRLYG